MSKERRDMDKEWEEWKIKNGYEMKTTNFKFMVLHRNKNLPEEEVRELFDFICLADNGAHARKQCLDAIPDADIVCAYRGY